MNDMSAKDEELKDRIISALKEIYDPEIPVNIYDLGLIYRIDIDEKAIVHLDMTLTAPGCPVAQTFPIQVADVIRAVEGVEDVELEMVWDPPWSVERMTEEAKVALGFFD
ncbi:MAG: FeS assembly system protein [Gammaproteobacteria bacterium]|jgi:FeS assembly SUF system protein|nr:FeS assembly system protein [Gammaproteobacteria bacterium]